MLSDVCPCDRLHTIAVGVKNVDEQGDGRLGPLFEFLDGLRRTAESTLVSLASQAARRGH